jgi:hypothetical protein
MSAYPNDTSAQMNARSNLFSAHLRAIAEWRQKYHVDEREAIRIVGEEGERLEHPTKYADLRALAVRNWNEHARISSLSNPPSRRTRMTVSGR